MTKFEPNQFNYLRDRIIKDKELFDTYFTNVFLNTNVRENCYNMLAFLSNRMKDSWDLLYECEIEEENDDEDS